MRGKLCTSVDIATEKFKPTRSSMRFVAGMWLILIVISDFLSNFGNFDDNNIDFFPKTL